MKKGLLLVAAICLLTAGTALAQVQNEEPEYIPGTQIMDFVKTPPIVGEIVKPTSSYFHAKRQVDFDVLIPVRDNFLPEMMKTTSSL